MSVETNKAKILEILSHGDTTKQDIITTLWLTPRQATVLLQELQAENLVYRTGSNYSLTPKEPKPKLVKKVVPVPEKPDYSIGIIRAIFGILSVGGSVISIRNTSMYLSTVFPLGWAIMLSSFMSMFMLSAFSAMVVFWHRKQYMVASGIGVLFTIVTLYSMSSTSIAMYNSAKESFVVKSTVERIDNNNQMVYNQYKDQEDSIKALIEAKQVTLNRYNKLIEPFTDITSKDYKTLSWNIADAEKYIATRTAELNGITTKKLAVIDSFDDTEVIAEDFYEMVQRVFGIQASLVQFLLSIMVAVFVDAISPIGGAIALFLKKEAK